jgi:hypothetical protein
VKRTSFHDGWQVREQVNPFFELTGTDEAGSNWGEHVVTVVLVLDKSLGERDPSGPTIA